MKTLLVTEKPDRWTFETPMVEVVNALDYLTLATYSRKGYRVFNLCDSTRYKSLGYYVSLLADARGHNPLPGVQTLIDLRYRTILKWVSDDVDDMIQRLLAPLQARHFVLSVYFGRNTAKRYDPLSRRLFFHFRAPLLRATFDYHERKKIWQLKDVRPISLREVPENHQPFLLESAENYFARRSRSSPQRKEIRYNLAILVDPAERQPPSNRKALEAFVQAAARLNIEADLIERSDLYQLATYDALFIRVTTRVDDHTFRSSTQAEKEGLVVIDDPTSILRCANKVFLQELLEHHRVPTPKTRILNRENIQEVLTDIGVPCIFKLPDSSFSLGVEKAKDDDAFMELANRYLKDSELVVVQEFMPSDFDWRVGVLDGKPLFACKYFMARNHWQIYKHPEKADGKILEGDSETMRVEDAPVNVIRTAVKAAGLIGKGLYGVDLKQIGQKVVVIEVNDNPNIDHGVEDVALGTALYDQVLSVFNQRLEARTRTVEK